MGVIFMFIEVLRFLFHPIFFLLILVFLGGVIILVIYINTLIINEKIFSVKLTKFLGVIFIRRLFFFLRKNTFYKISVNRFSAIIIYEKINFFLLIFFNNLSIININLCCKIN